MLFVLSSRSDRFRNECAGKSADPFGKDIVALYRANSVTKKTMYFFWIFSCKFGSLSVLRQELSIVIS